jgi:hypothetical protein
MDEIRRQDLKAFAKELLNGPRLFATVVTTLAMWSIIGMRDPFGGPDRPLMFGVAAVVALMGMAAFAYRASLDKRFVNRRYLALWQGCQDRLRRFREVQKRSRRTEVADLREMPNTVERISDSLYVALRKADLISHEVLRTERNLYATPPAWNAAASDAQSRELYRIADRNIAEYRQQYAGVMAGVERAEAQSAVFMTTLDTLRMKMLGYQLVGKSPEMPSQDFLEAINEAKLQLKAIDHALEELELGPYPKQITVMPDGVEQGLRENLDRTTPPPIPPHLDVHQKSSES